MKKPAMEFLSFDSIGQSEDCLYLFNAIRPKLYEWFDQGLIIGWSGRIVNNHLEANDDAILFDYLQYTNGRFPFVYFCVQVDDLGSDEYVNTFFRENNFERLSNLELYKFLG